MLAHVYRTMKKTTRRRLRYAAAAAAVLALVTVLAAYAAMWTAQGPKSEVLTPVVFDSGRMQFPTAALTVMSVNLAHGRGASTFQSRRSREQVEPVLDRIATFIREQSPHVVALQEADVRAWWSGRFNHVLHVGRRSGMPYGIVGVNVDGFGFAYGTGILSALPIVHAANHTARFRLPAFPKGWTLCTVALSDGVLAASAADPRSDRSPTGSATSVAAEDGTACPAIAPRAGRRRKPPVPPGLAGRRLDIVSLHLDVLAAANRRREVMSMSRVLLELGNPCIVMGDFNCEIGDGENTIEWLMQALDLDAFRPGDGSLVSFPPLRKRLDWILISPELEFRRYEHVDHGNSDHLAVVATVAFVPGQGRGI